MDAPQDVPEKVNLAAKLARIQEHWKPHVVAELNGQEVKLTKLQGPFVWHHHENEDELFLVMKGKMTMGLRTGDIELSEGETADALGCPRGTVKSRLSRALSRLRSLLTEGQVPRG